MRKENISLVDKIKRAQELAGIKPLHESNKGNLATITYNEKIKDINYGIIKEQGSYFIKTSKSEVIKESTDFDYIGGLGNKNEYKYNSYADALKNLNMIKITINESLTDCDDEEVLEERLTKDINAETQGQPPLAPGESPLPQQQAPSPAPMPSELPPPAPQQSAPQPDAAPAPSPEGIPAPEDNGGDLGDDSDLDGPDNEDDIDHYLGKLTYKISQAPEDELSDNKIKAILNSVISALPLDMLSPEERLVLAKRVKRGGKKEGEDVPSEQSQGKTPVASTEPEVQTAPEEEPIQEGDEQLPPPPSEIYYNPNKSSNDVAPKSGSIPPPPKDAPDPICEMDEKKMNEFYSSIDKSKLIFENSKLKYKNVLLESDGKNTLTMSTADKSFAFNVSNTTIKKYDSLINETRVLSESKIKLNSIIK